MARPEPHLDGILNAQGASARAQHAAASILFYTALGDIITLFTVAECLNFVKAAGYKDKPVLHALDNAMISPSAISKTIFYAASKLNTTC